MDDHTVSRRVLRRQLESWGMSCTDCGTSAAALELVSSGDPYDIAVLDMTMPELDGQQLARELRRLPAGRALPLVLLSSVPTRLEADEPPLFAAVLTKPARAKVLQDAITSVLLPTTTVLRALETAGGARSLDGPPAGRPVALRVLLAEDNVVNQMVAQLMLDRSGHHVDTVSNGQEALDALHRRPYDVVLMDMQMPVLDGLTAIRRLRAELPLARQPYVLALTASALVTDRQACAAAGANTFLSKPVQQAELDEALADVVPLQLTEQQPLLAP